MCLKRRGASYQQEKDAEGGREEVKEEDGEGAAVEDEEEA